MNKLNKEHYKIIEKMTRKLGKQKPLDQKIQKMVNKDFRELI